MAGPNEVINIHFYKNLFTRLGDYVVNSVIYSVLSLQFKGTVF